MLTIEYLETIKNLVQNNKDRNEDFWDEKEAQDTEYVLDRLDKEIKQLKIHETELLKTL